ncbi:type IV toxin-antitoxin system AbiEi family antitoxin domain-containing protein [Sinomonas soli]
MKTARQRLPRGAFSLHEADRGGVSKSTLYRLVEEGVLEKVGPGLFVAGDEIDFDLDLVEAARRAPMSTLCLVSALARHELIDEIPSSIDLALPRGTNPPHLAGPIDWHLFDRATFDLGRSMVSIEGSRGVRVGLYSAERSIVDAFRLRGAVGYETGIEALRNWLRRRGSQPAKLLELASALPRAKAPLQRALEVLL